MLGMVNHALQEMVVERHGEEVWAAICADAGVQEPVFVIMRPYPDQVTFDLAAAVVVCAGRLVAFQAPFFNFQHRFLPKFVT